MRNADLDILETISLKRVRENKQYLKMAAKYEKDLDLLRRKHEKVNETTGPKLMSSLYYVFYAHAVEFVRINWLS